MVHLNRISTKSGDGGETSLGDGNRVPKTHPRITAYGSTDELNAILGVAIAAGLPDDVARHLKRIQNDLFDLGADLCVPESDPPRDPPPLRVDSSQVANLERCIDAFNDRLTPLESFVLPGGSVAAAHLHHARTVCRRAEIAVLHLTESATEPVNPQIAVYLNRLSDLLFVLARICNDDGKADELWIPGESRTTGE